MIVLSPMAEQPISVRKYAKHLGVTHQAVRKAIDAGRLSASIVHNDRGHPKIADVELADREWAAGRQPQATDAPEAGGEDNTGYSAHRARKEAALADLAELKLRQRRGELVDVRLVTAEWVSQAVAVKTKLLGIPTRLRQRVPGVSGAVAGAVDDLIREALEELADAR